MITFDKFWETLNQKGISQYKLINTYQISGGLLDRLRNNRNINTNTLDQLCAILDCELSDIVEYKREEDYHFNENKYLK